MSELVHVRAIASSCVHLLDISDHSVYVWRDEDEVEYRHDSDDEAPSYRCIARPARTLCGARLGNRSTRVVVMRGWDPSQVCRMCQRLSRGMVKDE